MPGGQVFATRSSQPESRADEVLTPPAMTPPATASLAGTTAPLSHSTSERTVDTVAGPMRVSSADAPGTGDSPMPNPGPDPDNELTDAKIAAAEARTDTKLRDVDVKFERVLGEVRLGFQELRTDLASFKGEVQTKAEARSNMQWTIGTLAALILAVAGLIVASFQTGLAVGVLPPKPPQLEASPAQPSKAPAPVVVPAPSAETPAIPQPNPVP